VKQCFDMARAVGPTIYFGSANSGRQIQEVSKAFAGRTSLQMTILWCYIRNDAFKVKGADARARLPHLADLHRSGQHSASPSRPTSSSRSLPPTTGGYAARTWAQAARKFDKRIYTELAGATRTARAAPIDLCRYQLINCAMGRSPLISSGGESKGAGDMATPSAPRSSTSAAGGMGLISGARRSSGR